MMWNEHPGDQVMRADKGKMTISGNLARKGREGEKKDCNKLIGSKKTVFVFCVVVLKTIGHLSIYLRPVGIAVIDGEKEMKATSLKE